MSLLPPESGQVEKGPLDWAFFLPHFTSEAQLTLRPKSSSPGVRKVLPLFLQEPNPKYIWH